MTRNLQKVPYGYVPPVETTKGTLIYYDPFEEIGREQGLSQAVQVKSEQAFQRLVLYPLHEQTMKRMYKREGTSFYKRENALQDWIQEQSVGDIELDAWEGKRKKYVPIEAALRHLTEKNPAPYFLLVSGETANAFASYHVFQEWIVKIRLLLLEEPASLHPRLQQYDSRWSRITL
ncbi:hypothetical protein JJQ72_09870 [Paenibacillus sp. F411]|uniref:hypothetical protein n=1 Tax=Paenibacillus sp. F411 TaxID=2820239 RepID=UPI001AAF063F|nr:hypothetical protein [Paenibacillus sp. F411]MBO2944273.1 hypothetical protein [Paenibacillus sp. F411]